MAFQLRRKRGIWQVRFTINGRQVERSTGVQDRAQANAEGARLYADAVSGRSKIGLTSAAPSTPLAHICGAWLEDIRGDLGEGTPALYERYAGFWCAFFPTLGAINPASAQTFCQDRLKRVLRATVQKELGALRRFLGWCESSGHLAEAPTLKSIPKLSKGRPHPMRRRSRAGHYASHEVEAFLAALPVLSDGGFCVRARYRFQYETGLRSSLLDRLKIGDVLGNQLKIRAEIDKSKYGRVVPLSEAAQDALAFALTRVSDNGEIFGRRDFIHWIQPAAVAAFGAERGRLFCPQHLRSIRATMWLDAGIPVTDVAHLLGHRKISTTAIYARPGLESAQRSLSALEGTIRDVSSKRPVILAETPHKASRPSSAPMSPALPPAMKLRRAE